MGREQMRHTTGFLGLGSLLVAAVLSVGAVAPQRASAMNGVSSNCYLLNPIQVCEVVEFEICFEEWPGEIRCYINSTPIYGEIRES
jgi:hypothetical protein